MMDNAPTGHDQNADQIAYWNGAGGQRWADRQPVQDILLQPVADILIDRARIKAGERVLDVGCGSGSTTFAFARAVGPSGHVMGIDISGPMLARAREVTPKGAPVEFVLADATVHSFTPENFDLLASRFGVMFFADPAAAFGNIRKALKPGGRLVFVCWRAPTENVWAFAPLMAARPFLPEQPPADPYAPGPFAFADSARLKGILESAGFKNVAIDKLDTVMHMAHTAADAARFSLTIGPLSRAAAELDDATRAKIVEKVTAALKPYETAAGVTPPAACWLVSARA
jgi:SAM-dependent methyltransferase